MLIKVFDRWLNPDAISHLDSVAHRTMVHLMHTTKVPIFLHKTEDEVAEEINKQLGKTDG